ncbi:MAG: hypothetical protein M9952_09110 [Microthrixaceae bacterium]|nr:hypothetical protein [Microthrixaceae bacterium]MCO5313073.1 hypothetical protein [Microthrixaceae bacterium]HPB45626.1 hypothetical protein [Microthrixaceae bacterium]
MDEFTGSVLDVSGRTALLADEQGNALPIPASTSHEGLTPGAFVAVDTERLDGGAATIWVRPAFVSDDDPHALHPGGVRLLTDAERHASREPAASTR